MDDLVRFLDSVCLLQELDESFFVFLGLDFRVERSHLDPFSGADKPNALDPVESSRTKPGLVWLTVANGLVLADRRGVGRKLGRGARALVLALTTLPITGLQWQDWCVAGEEALAGDGACGLAYAFASVANRYQCVCGGGLRLGHPLLLEFDGLRRYQRNTSRSVN